MTAKGLITKAARAAASAKILLHAGDADGACNHAYYAMFDAARAVLLAAELDVGKTHRGVLSTFSDQLVKTGAVSKEMGRLLKHAETFRYVADYEGGSVDADDARGMVEQAAHFVSAMQTVLQLKG